MLVTVLSLVIELPEWIKYLLYVIEFIYVLYKILCLVKSGKITKPTITAISAEILDIVKQVVNAVKSQPVDELKEKVEKILKEDEDKNGNE